MTSSFRFLLVVAASVSLVSTAGCAGKGDGSGGVGGAAGTGGAAAGGAAGGSGGGAGGAGTGGSGGTAGADAGVPDATPWTHGIDRRVDKQTCVPPANMNNPPTLLSQTGCFDAKDPTKPAPGLVPYSVATPLWSDAAAKDRFVALPDGAKIHVKSCAKEPDTCKPVAEGGTPGDDGDFVVPAGTVLVKSFRLGNKLVETRLLVRFDEYTWQGYSYNWREDQTDAVVWPDAIAAEHEEIDLGGGKSQRWTFPTRAECFQCHTEAAATSIGLELAQLNYDLTYPSGIKSNQLATWEHIGMFDAPLARPYPAVFPTPIDDTTGTLAQRARAYLHENCSMCHRPGSNYAGMDFRYGTPLADTMLCNVTPEKGDLGVAGARRLVPGDPARSVMTLRMKDLGNARMPQIGTRMVDVNGVKIVEDWIASLASCP